jgi:hypothetical protein
MHPESAMTCGYDLGGSRRFAADDDTMCPECARLDYQLGNKRKIGSHLRRHSSETQILAVSDR